MGIKGVPITAQDIKDALALKRGIIRHAAEELNISPNTIYEHMKRDPEIVQALKEARESADSAREDEDRMIVVEARNSIRELLKDKNIVATLFALKSKDGWVEKRDAPQIENASQAVEDLYNKKHAQD